ncbi:c-type cytochrome [Tardiphaga sp.]|uniref:c-type cytochrome n=1 Tax=Tardiphaga sp. TaxID=1926292 RepID=UPI0026378712|nr:c-type cytochrome [Tardiphaga sp.]MDB5620225.1 cytochrome [Tardiphaga sp.]
MRLKPALESVARLVLVLGGSLTLLISGNACAQAPNVSAPSATPPPESILFWAYPWDTTFNPPPADDVLQRLPGSAAAYSSVQSRNLFLAPDWHPDDHPPMPEIVALGRKPDVRACGSCHRADGAGGPENASLAGLPAAYMVQQIADFKNGTRKFSGPPRTAVTLMVAVAKAMTEAESQTAADYFSALTLKKNIKVIESDSVPETYVARLFFAKQPAGGTEPLGPRIIEVPDDVVQFELRDTRSQFTAYVPVGSIKRGKALAAVANGAVQPCATCHGEDLRGVADIPRIAGRSPSYLARQLYDFQHGARTSDLSALMKPMVEGLSQDDIVSLAAYVASLDP